MKISEFIEKAIEGGWHPKPWQYAIEMFYVKQTNQHVPRETLMTQTAQCAILLDSLAWEAVGKVEGWEDPRYPEKKEGVANRLVGMPEWRIKMHEMVDDLCEGRALEEFLKKL